MWYLSRHLSIDCHYVYVGFRQTTYEYVQQFCVQIQYKNKTPEQSSSHNCMPADDAFWLYPHLDMWYKNDRAFDIYSQLNDTI